MVQCNTAMVRCIILSVLAGSLLGLASAQPTTREPTDEGLCWRQISLLEDIQRILLQASRTPVSHPDPTNSCVNVSDQLNEMTHWLPRLSTSLSSLLSSIQQQDSSNKTQNSDCLQTVLGSNALVSQRLQDLHLQLVETKTDGIDMLSTLARHQQNVTQQLLTQLLQDIMPADLVQLLQQHSEQLRNVSLQVGVMQKSVEELGEDESEAWQAYNSSVQECRRHAVELHGEQLHRLSELKTRQEEIAERQTRLIEQLFNGTEQQVNAAKLKAFIEDRLKQNIALINNGTSNIEVLVNEYLQRNQEIISSETLQLKVNMTHSLQNLLDNVSESLLQQQHALMQDYKELTKNTTSRVLDGQHTVAESQSSRLDQLMKQFHLNLSTQLHAMAEQQDCSLNETRMLREMIETRLKSNESMETEKRVRQRQEESFNSTRIMLQDFLTSNKQDQAVTVNSTRVMLQDFLTHNKQDQDSRCAKIGEILTELHQSNQNVSDRLIAASDWCTDAGRSNETKLLEKFETRGNETRDTLSRRLQEILHESFASHELKVEEKLEEKLGKLQEKLGELHVNLSRELSDRQQAREDRDSSEGSSCNSSDTLLTLLQSIQARLDRLDARAPLSKYKLTSIHTDST